MSNKPKQTFNPQHLFSSAVKASSFAPPFWARNRHVQTLWPRFFQRRKAFKFHTERFVLPDKDFVKLVWGKSIKPQKSKGLAVIFHGLEGSIKSHYANDMMAELQNNGWQTVLMHFRGCGGEPNNTHRAYHSGETQDAEYFLTWLDKKFPDMPKLAIGFSLGANMLLKWLGENPKQTLIKAGVAISAPLKLSECANSINKGFSRVYQNYLLKSMVSNLREKMKRIDYRHVLTVDDEKVAGLRNFREFDENVTAPLHGFASADDYYHKCSAIHFLQHIQTPTLVLHSVDDPFMNAAVIPKADEVSPSVEFELSLRGGHVGFMQGTPWKPNIWFHQRVLSYLDSVIQKTQLDK